MQLHVGPLVAQHKLHNCNIKVHRSSVDAPARTPWENSRPKITKQKNFKKVFKKYTKIYIKNTIT